MVSTSDRRLDLLRHHLHQPQHRHVESAVRVFQAGQGPHAARTAAPTASRASVPMIQARRLAPAKARRAISTATSSADQRLHDGEREEDLRSW